MCVPKEVLGLLAKLEEKTTTPDQEDSESMDTSTEEHDSGAEPPKGEKKKKTNTSRDLMVHAMKVSIPHNIYVCPVTTDSYTHLFYILVVSKLC